MDLRPIKKLTSGNLIQLKLLISNIWRKVHTALFFALLLFLVGLGAWIWQQKLYGKGWSDEKKQDYINTQANQIKLNEADLNRALEDINQRNIRQSENKEPLKDIFKSY